MLRGRAAWLHWIYHKLLLDSSIGFLCSCGKHPDLLEATMDDASGAAVKESGTCFKSYISLHSHALRQPKVTAV